MLHKDSKSNLRYLQVYNSKFYLYRSFWTYWNSWALDARVGRWTLDTGLRTLDSALDSGFWTLDPGRETLEVGRWTLDAGL